MKFLFNDSPSLALVEWVILDMNHSKSIHDLDDLMAIVILLENDLENL